MATSTYVYIMADKPRGTLHVGVASDLTARVRRHREELCGDFSERFSSGLLVWYEAFPDGESAAGFYKTLRKAKRGQKVRLIETVNPEWRDLALTLRSS